MTLWNPYKDFSPEFLSVCHFIAAFTHMEEKISQRRPSFFTLKAPKQIEQFLSLAHWFRKKLLCLETPNVKEKLFFSDQTLIPLPDWIMSDKVNISIEPYQDIIERIEVQVNDPKNLVIPEEKRKKYIEQRMNKLKEMEASLNVQERKRRTRRLIELGGLVSKLNFKIGTLTLS